MADYFRSCVREKRGMDSKETFKREKPLRQFVHPHSSRCELGLAVFENYVFKPVCTDISKKNDMFVLGNKRNLKISAF